MFSKLSKSCDARIARTGDEPIPSDASWDDVVDEHFPAWGGAAGILFTALDEVDEETERHRPHLLLSEVEVGDADVEQSGEDLPVSYPGYWSWGFGEDLTPRASVEGFYDGFPVDGLVGGDGEQPDLVLSQLGLWGLGVLEVVDEDGLVGEQGDQPDHFTQDFLGLASLLEGVAEVLQSSVAGGDLPGSPGCEDEFNVALADADHCRQPSSLGILFLLGSHRIRLLSRQVLWWVRRPWCISL